MGAKLSHCTKKGHFFRLRAVLSKYFGVCNKYLSGVLLILNTISCVSWHKAAAEQGFSLNLRALGGGIVYDGYLRQAFPEAVDDFFEPPRHVEGIALLAALSAPVAGHVLNDHDGVFKATPYNYCRAVAPQIFRQIVQIERSKAAAFQAKFVQDDEKYASKRRQSPTGGNCAALPLYKKILLSTKYTQQDFFICSVYLHQPIQTLLNLFANDKSNNVHNYQRHDIVNCVNDFQVRRSTPISMLRMNKHCNPNVQYHRNN